MISTKINVDTSELLKAFKLLESQGKLTADNIDKAFNNSLKIEVDSSDFKKIETEATTMFGKLKNNLKGSFDMSQILNFSAGGLVTGAVEKGLSLVAEGFSQAIEKGSEFEKQLNAVGAVTGQSGEALDKIGESALELSKTFGGDANAQLGAFQGILSKFGAQLAETPQYLNEVTKNVNLLAKAGGIDATTAMNSLTDVMMQFGVDVTDGATAAKESARYMNVLAASAQVGSAEITDVSASILQVGVTAKSAGLSLEETNSAIQILAGGGKKGSEAGVALRNSLQYLQKQSGEGEKVLAKMGLTTLQLGKTLGKEGLDNTLKLVGEGLKKLGGQTEQNQAMFQLFGADASAMGILLKGAGGQMDAFTKQMTGTQSGVEQAKVNMQGFSESMSRLKSNIDAGLIKSFMVVKQAIADIFVFIKPFLELWWEIFDATTLTLWSNVFSTAFGIIKSTLSDAYNSVMEIVNIFKSMFGEMESGIDIIDILKTTFEVLGRIIGTAVTIQIQLLSKIFQASAYVVKELILFVKGLGDRFNEFVKSNKMVSDFVGAVSEKFRQLGEWISKSAKSVTGFLQSIGLLSKDKSTKDLNKDLKETAKTTEEVKTNIEGTTKGIEGTTNAVVKQKAEIKSLQQQYNDLYEATVKLSQENNRGLQYEKNIKQLEVLKGKLKELETNKALVDFRLADNKVEIPDMVLDSFKNEIDTYFEKEKVTLSIAKVEVKTDAIKPIEESETDKMFKNLAKSLTDGFSKIDYTSIFKKKETAFDESLNEDRANLLTSLQQNELSYEEYSERLNEIDRNRRETQKEGNSEFIQGLNETLSISLQNTSNMINESITKSMTLLSEVSYKSDDFTTQLSSNIETALVGIGTMTAEMALNGQNLMKSLLMNVIKTAQIMFNAYAAPLLLKSNLERPFGLGTPEWIALMVLGNATLGLAQSALAGFKDGVINLQGAGTSRSDSIPAMLSKGESVINARSTAQNEPYLRFINNGGDMSKLVNMNMNTKNIENLLYTNNELLRSKNFNPSINNVNKFNVSSSSIKVVRGR